MRFHIMTFVAVGLGLVGTTAMGADLTLRGSDATLGVMKSLAEAYTKETSKPVKVEGGGGGAGIKAVQAGEVQIAFLTRPLKDAEIKSGLVGTAYAYDAVAMIVNKNNPTDNVSAEELKNLYAGKTEKWSDGKPVMLLGRNKEANVRDVLMEKIMGDTPFSEKIVVKHAAAMMDTVEKAPAAIGYVSAGDVNPDKVKTLGVNGVKPTPQTIRDKSYPITLTPTLATKGEATGEAKAFIDWVLSSKGQELVAKGKLVPVQTGAAPAK